MNGGGHIQIGAATNTADPAEHTARDGLGWDKAEWAIEFPTICCE